MRARAAGAAALVSPGARARPRGLFSIALRVKKTAASTPLVQRPLTARVQVSIPVDASDGGPPPAVPARRVGAGVWVQRFSLLGAPLARVWAARRAPPTSARR
jgi:hypothetical protein